MRCRQPFLRPLELRAPIHPLRVRRLPPSCQGHRVLLHPGHWPETSTFNLMRLRMQFLPLLKRLPRPPHRNPVERNPIEVFCFNHSEWLKQIFKTFLQSFSGVAY